MFHSHDHGHSHKDDEHEHLDAHEFVQHDDSEAGVHVHPEQKHHSVDHYKPHKRDSSCNSHSHSHDGQMNMQGVLLHLIGDALGSVAVIIGATINLVTPLNRDGTRKHFVLYVDPIISLLITALIVYTTIPLTKATIRVLLQSSGAINVEKIRERIRDISGVLGIHELHVWQLTDTKYVASVHLSVYAPGSLDMKPITASICDKVREIFHEQGVHSSTVQVEYVDEIFQSPQVNSFFRH